MSFRDYLKIGFLEIKCKNVNFRNWIWRKLEFWKLFESLGFKKKIKLRKLGLWKLNLKEIKIENYLRSRHYENSIIKIGNLGNHSKAEFLEINE